jgi:hypothetical protein
MRQDRTKEIYRNYRKRSDMKRKLAGVRRHTKIIEELKKEHEDFLKGKTYATNISAPGEEPSGEEGVLLSSDGCSFCGLKGHKTKNSVQCLYSTKLTSKYNSSDNRAGEGFLSGEGEFCAHMKILCGSAMGRQY